MEYIVANYRKTVTKPVEDITRFRFWRAVIAEFVGTMFLTAIGCGTVVGKDWQSTSTSSMLALQLRVALAFGLILQAVAWSIGYDSGGHVNPAITLGVLSVGRISIIRAVFYIVVQMFGAVAGAAIVYELTPVGIHESLGVTEPRPDLSLGQCVGVEIFITFILGFVVAASCDKSRSDIDGSAPLTIGLTVAACQFFAIKYTGASMNPARSFGPALIMEQWKSHWVYWVGPIIGGVAGTFIYDTLFEAHNRQSDAPFRAGEMGYLQSSGNVFAFLRPSKGNFPGMMAAMEQNEEGEEQQIERDDRLTAGSNSKLAKRRLESVAVLPDNL